MNGESSGVCLQSRYSFFLQHRFLLLSVVIGCGFALRMCVAWAPFEWLLQYVIGDDSFYYFQIARNITRHAGISFDGLSPTNGFHPLWLCMITPCFLIRDLYLPIRLVLSYAALIDTGSCYLLSRILGKLGVSSRTSLLCVAAYAFFPPTLLSVVGPMNGLETALNSLCILWVCYAYLALRGSPSLPRFVAYGVACGMSFLARTDNAILVVIASAWFLLRSRSTRSLVGMVVSGIVALLLVIPWLTWTWNTFQSLVQVSGKSVAFVARQLLSSGAGFRNTYVYECLRNLGNTFALLFGSLSFIRLSLEFLIGIMLMSWVGWRLMGPASETSQRRACIERIGHLIPFILFVPVFVVVQTMRIVHFRPWYHFTMIPVLMLVVAVIVDCAFATESERQPSIRQIPFRTAALLALIVSCCYAISCWSVFRDTTRRGELDKYATVKDMNHLLPVQTVVGAWNAGIYGYFFENGTVVNLDGAVNNDIYPWIVKRESLSYVKNAGIRYLVDDLPTLNNWSLFWTRDGSPIMGSLEILGTRHGIVIGRLK